MERKKPIYECVTREDLHSGQHNFATADDHLKPAISGIRFGLASAQHSEDFYTTVSLVDIVIYLMVAASICGYGDPHRTAQGRAEK